MVKRVTSNDEILGSIPSGRSAKFLCSFDTYLDSTNRRLYKVVSYILLLYLQNPFVDKTLLEYLK